MSERDKKNRNKNTFIRIKTRKLMRENLSKGLHYGKGANFFHPTKQDIAEGHHGGRY
jgi:hypothetical protein